nr:MAG TPA: hypothetical protein [Caudoviricetes sp.]
MLMLLMIRYIDLYLVILKVKLIMIDVVYLVMYHYLSKSCRIL